MKSLKLNSGIIQSPMAGCTNLAFRLIARRHGMEFAFLEMVSADALVRSNARTLDLMKTTAEDKPLGAQIVGCDPDIMGEAAAIIEDLGFDLVDINMGCPVPKVTAPGGGSALLASPDTAKQIFSAVIKKVRKIPVTVKMRKGFADETGAQAVRIARDAENAGLSAVAVHGRTRIQGYSGKADWEAIEKVQRAVKIPVFGNGDVFTSQDALRLKEVSGCAGIMVGRGALGNPWLYKEIEAVMNHTPPPPAPTLAEKKQVALQHLELEIQTDNERRAVLKCRRILSWYLRESPGAARFRDELNQAETARQMRDLIQSFFPVKD